MPQREPASCKGVRTRHHLKLVKKLRLTCSEITAPIILLVTVATVRVVASVRLSTPNQIHKEKLYSKDKVSPKRVADSFSHERVRDKYEPLKNWIHRDHDEGYAKSHPKSFAVRHVPDLPTNTLKTDENKR